MLNIILYMSGRFSFFFHIRTKLIISYAAIILSTILVISVIFFTFLKQGITRLVREQDQFLAEQLSINLSEQLKSMEELQFNQYRYSLLGDLLINIPTSESERINQSRKISESLIRLYYSNSYFEGAAVIDNNGTIYSYNIINDKSFIDDAALSNSEELLMKHGKVIWSIDKNGRLLLHRLLINIFTTRTVGQIIIPINSRFLTRNYEDDTTGTRGHILIFDKEGHFIPSINPDINIIAPLLFQSDKMKTTTDFSHNREQYVVSKTVFPDGDFEMFHVLSLKEIGIYTRTLPFMTVLAALAAIIATIIVANIISGRVTGGINLLIKGIRRFAAGDLKSPVEVKSQDEIGYLAMEFNHMADSINNLISNIYDAELKKRKAETNALQFEYSALESKINPHFIYNTLESVNSLAKIKGDDDISQIICLLGSLLRDNISSTVEIIPLLKEIDNISKYLQIQKLAYGEKFNIHITIKEEAQQAMVPKFILQPLVENALYHGILVSTRHGNLSLVAERRVKNLNITLRDDGAGMSKEKLLELLDYSIESKNETGTHTKVGVRAVDKRLKILYGEEYGLEIESEENAGTTVNLIMPFFNAEDEKLRQVDNV